VVTLKRLEDGVCPVVVLIFGRREIGKTTLLAALAPDLAPPDHLVIVSPLPTLKAKLPAIEWYKISSMRKEEIEKLFSRWKAEGKHLMVLADEGDELSGAGPAGYSGGFVSPSVYDWVNYQREFGGGIALSTRRHTNVARDTSANANLVFIGNTTDPGSLRFYKEWLEDPTDNVDYIRIIRVLPDYVFLVWQPGMTPKFQGYVTVGKDGKIRSWDPKELKEPLEEEPETEEATTDPDESSESAAPSPGRSASPLAATAPSPTGPAPTSARSTTKPGPKKGIV
jgi:hypothetical protein